MPYSGEHVIEHLIRLISDFSFPKDILTAYLCRPLVGVSIRRGIEQIAKGKFGRNLHRRPLSDGEIMTRAQQLLRWLDGKESDVKNPYEVLGLNYSASPAQTLHRYRVLSKRVHPDRHTPARQDYWSARQQEVNQAYQILSDPESRAQYLARVAERKDLLRRLWQVESWRRR